MQNVEETFKTELKKDDSKVKIRKGGLKSELKLDKSKLSVRNINLKRFNNNAVN